MHKQQLSLDLIPHEANGSVIHQRAADGYINATALCKAAGKLWSDYRRLGNTVAFMDALQADMGIPISELVHSLKGGDPHLQGTWVHPQIAINLGVWLSAEFAVRVSKWIYDWMSGKGAPRSAPAEMPYHIRRHVDNLHKVPPTHFSILQEMSMTLLGPLEVHGYTLPETMLPDISQGRMFCGFLRKRGFDPSTLPTYRHSFPNGREVEAKLYPIDLLGEFRKFIAEVWMPERSEEYFRQRDAGALPYLSKVLRLEAPTNMPNFKRLA